MQPISPIADLSAAQERALEIYCTMPVVRHATIAKRVGVSKEQAQQWISKGNWLDLRANMRKQRENEISERRAQSAEQLLTATTSLIATMSRRIKDDVIQNKDLKPIAEALCKLRALQCELYDELGD